jgi:hypothetical protein
MVMHRERESYYRTNQNWKIPKEIKRFIIDSPITSTIVLIGAISAILIK